MFSFRPMSAPFCELPDVRGSFDTAIAVLMSVYINTSAREMREAYSSLANQEDVDLVLLLAVDGPISSELSQMIYGLLPKGAVSGIKIYNSLENRGLAAAMNLLILNEFNNYSYFVRQDSDDISLPPRVRTQIQAMNLDHDLDICGSSYELYDKDSCNSLGIVEMPTSHIQIARAFKSSSPIAHPTAIFRPSFFVKAGLYSPNHATLAEDSRLWYSGLYVGCKFGNVSDVLYRLSADQSTFKRRSNIRQILIIYKIRMRYIVHVRLGLRSAFLATI